MSFSKVPEQYSYKEVLKSKTSFLISVGEKGWKDEWINKKYNKKYYGLQYTIGNLPFLRGSDSGNSDGFREQISLS